ncbi:MAG: hypothetical protein ACE5KD_04755 [Candidatus Bathyarchaeia archaeon]
MAEVEISPLGQESIHETFRILIPGYFAVFLLFTLYPQLFESGVGVALVLAGGIGFGIVLNGINLQSLLPVFSFRSPRIRRMMRKYETDKLKHMLTIIGYLGYREAYENIENMDKHYDFYYHLWNNFSYSTIPDAARARQRIYASLFFLYANCAWVVFFYSLFVATHVFVYSLSPDWGYGLTKITMYQISFDTDFTILCGYLIRISLSLVGSILFGIKARNELKGSMMFQKIAMKYYREKLYDNLEGVLKLHEKIEEKEE